MDNLYGYYYGSIDNKNRFIIPTSMRQKITGEIGSVIIRESIMRYYDVEKLYKTIDELKKGSYSSEKEEHVKRVLKELCMLFSNLRVNVKIDSQGRIILPEIIAKKASEFPNVEGKRNIKIIGEGQSIVTIPSQSILNDYENGLYADYIMR